MDTNQTLAQIAVTHPAASRIFHAHRLDYCCGGRRPLEEACRERDLDPAEVLDEIRAGEAEPSGPDPASAPLGELTQHIVARFHEPLRVELPQLIALAEKVEARHHDKESCPRGLADHLRSIHESVMLHLDKEEQVLFPMIQAGRGRQTGGLVHVMEDEHHEHARNLQRTRELAHGFQPPEEACTSWRALYLRLDTLEADLMEHIHLENNVLFPRALCE